MLHDPNGLVSRWGMPAKRCGTVTIVGAFGVLWAVAYAAAVALG